MGSSSRQTRRERIVRAAEARFGEAVLDVTMPGGESRSSCRLHLAHRTVIATLRPNFRRAHLEAFVLKKLRPFTQDAPECLGIDGEIVFQSDIGTRRLNVEIAKVGQSRRRDLAGEAVSKIFRIQRAAMKAGLNTQMPHLGVNVDWISNFTNAIDALAPLSAGRSAGVDRVALAEAVQTPATQFVKWDCRSGNAALDKDDVLKWFDFEYAGVRHGAEDHAWLIGDEAWPLPPEIMEDLVIDAFDPNLSHQIEAYLDYLGVYVTLHCVQRLKLISKEARKRGWLSKTRVRKYDDAGVHPEFAGHLCRVGAYFGARQALTTPIGRDFEDAARVFDQMISRAA
ncbi:hypothetical protein [Antarctobacter heliothermus]|uniref:Aminoglycoside phosphotransferase domain-containing protein n=1 Tax=Antarctobacter heliothermus TaxID=74033 RepID=A0A239EQV0_9RHOB|nr:hypothetical protein [Antarctobacter heliothermus]SNS46403.1 hypothetical protein SAMN04488078_101613 [Antarctobacter heliothermus]